MFFEELNHKHIDPGCISSGKSPSAAYRSRDHTFLDDTASPVMKGSWGADDLRRSPHNLADAAVARPRGSTFPFCCVAHSV